MKVGNRSLINTWEVVDCPSDASVIESVIFNKKIIDGVEKKNARLIARGYQQPSLENENIYVSVVPFITLRALLLNEVYI